MAGAVVSVASAMAAPSAFAAQRVTAIPAAGTDAAVPVPAASAALAPASSTAASASTLVPLLI